MRNNPLVVFAYAFSHRKTFDFIETLISNGFSNLYVVAAPKVKLKNTKATASSLLNSIPTAKELSKKYGLKYIEVAHSSVEEIKRFVPAEAKTAIIAGARILSKEVINIFEFGVINFHPGAIPETSGLDSFFWMIEKNAKPGITVHYIDHKVDAGELIFFYNAAITEVITESELKEEIYNSQILALKRLLKYFVPHQKCLTEKLYRPAKNEPMNEKEKTRVSLKFNQWLENQKKIEEMIHNCYRAIKGDDLNLLIKNYLNEFNSYKNNYGRGLVSECAYYNSLKCLSFLIEKKCDVNEANDKGTTPIMYSKTMFMNESSKNNLILAKEVIKKLKKAGADVNIKDVYGKTVFDYLNGENAELIASELVK